MRRVANVMQLIFWTSVPLFAVYLAVSSVLSVDSPAWLGWALWMVVLASSAYLASQTFPPVSDEVVHSEARASGVLVYPITLLLASLPPFAHRLF